MSQNYNTINLASHPNSTKEFRVIMHNQRIIINGKQCVLSVLSKNVSLSQVLLKPHRLACDKAARVNNGE